MPPYQFNDYKWFGKGIHHKDGLEASGFGGKGRIVTGTKTDVGPQGAGYYIAKLEIYNSEFPNNGGWKVKESKGGISTFFPDHWTKDKVQQELAKAFRNKKYDKHNAWIGTMTDGVKIEFRITSGIITSAYPVF